MCALCCNLKLFSCEMARVLVVLLLLAFWGYSVRLCLCVCVCSELSSFLLIIWMVNGALPFAIQHEYLKFQPVFFVWFPIDLNHHHHRQVLLTIASITMDSVTRARLNHVFKAFFSIGTKKTNG